MGQWIVLGFVSSSLVVCVTMPIKTDIVAKLGEATSIEDSVQPWQAALSASWKENLLQHGYETYDSVNLEPNLVSTVDLTWWALPWLVLMYSIILLGSTACLILYLSKLDSTQTGRAPIRRVRRRHRCQIQHQNL